MRPVDELARLWNDTRMRMPPSAWLWPVLAAAVGAVVIVIGVAASEWPTEADTDSAPTNAAMTVVATPAGCEDQTWPYYSGACLRGGGQAGRVRVLEYEPALAAAAIGATQWTPKAQPPSSREAPSRHKQATHNPDRTATDRRSGRRSRNATREPTYAVPPDAFSAYGSARR